MDPILDMRMIKKTSNCLISGKPISRILDFGMHPYADTFISDELLDKNEPVFPLEVYLNPDNGQVQLSCITNDYDRYNLYSYSYTSSNSNFAKKHWISYKDKIVNKFNPINKFIVEIGSNDGFLIGMFSDTNNILGIDSSKEMVNIANNNNINSIQRIFNKKVSEEIVNSNGKCDIVIANNVFNHSNDPVDFAKGVSNMLNDDGVFIFELPYWLDTVKSKKFDQIYHEHISYFTVKSSYYLLKEAGLEIFDIEIVDYHGGSIRVYSRKSNNVEMNECVKSQILIEEENGLFEHSTYKSWQEEIEFNRNKFLLELLKLKCDYPNAVIIGVGAAAKANTFLNYYRLDNSFINYITDSSPHKIGKSTPLTRIPIVSDDEFSKYDDVYAMILSWNISDDLKNILLKINPKIKFINI
jgi:2-polyprenyl-3-methyl-5-hydroxy-6-metoxy-1,4-benzoquinol methylase